MDVGRWLGNKFSGIKRRLGVSSKEISLREFLGNIHDIPQEERTATAMHRAFYENSGIVVHKWRGYMQHYDHHLSRFRDTPVRVLEIGVNKGGALQMWRRYFGDRATLFGIDIDPDCAQFDGSSGEVRIGSQDDTDFLLRVVAEMGGVDVVIDDGSHIATHQQVSFSTLFPKLDQNGVYICEDTHTAYWSGHYEGGYGKSNNFIEVAKKLIDDIHSDFHAHPSSIKDAKRIIKGVHFYNSMVVIEKAPQPPSMHLQIC